MEQWAKKQESIKKLLSQIDENDVPGLGSE